MNVLRLIAQSKHLFSTSELKVADFILESPNEVLGMNISQIANAARVSTATVNRFYKVLKIPSFSDFKVRLSTAVAGKNRSEVDDIFYKSVDKEDNVNSIALKLMNNTMKAYRGTMDRIDAQTIEAVGKKTYTASEVFAYGVGASSLVAENMAQKWNRVGKRISFTTDLHTLLTGLSTAKDNALIFLISNSGESPEVIYAANYAASIGMTIVSITEPSNNSLAKLSNFPLQTALAFEGEYRIAATTSLSAQFFLINILYSRYVNLYADDAVKQLESTHDLLNNYKKSIRIVGGHNRE